MYCLAAALFFASVASAAVTTVTVGSGGSGGFVYTPNSITAAVNDTITFKFTGAPGNHTVSQAAFSAPCTQLSGGFDSGFVFVPSGFSGTPTEWNLTITDASKPIWFYCKQRSTSPHCIAGMVGAINPPSSGNTLAAFTAASRALSSLPNQSPGSLTGVGASASAAPSVPGAAASSTSSGSSASSTSPSSASSTASSKAIKMASVGATGLWTLLAGVVGIVVA